MRNWNLTLSTVVVLVAIPLPIYAELLISSSESYSNTEVLENTDLILNYGEFRNTGLVDNLDGSEFVNYGQMFNHSFMQFQWNSSLSNYGEFDNFGDVSASSINNGFTGSFENQSSITLREGFDSATSQPISAELNNSGVFDNNGFIDVFSSAGFNLTNSNTFNNNGVINANGPVQITNSGVFNNLGEFNTSWNELLNIDNSGEFVNSANLNLGEDRDAGSGSIITTNRFINHAVVQGGDAIQNSGYFENNGDIWGAKTFENTGDVINAGRISVDSEIINLATSTFNNLVGGVVEAGNRLENRGVFENLSSIMLRDGFDSVAHQFISAELDNSGVFNNNGTIDVYSRYGFNLTNSNVFNNNGIINNTDGPVHIVNSGVFNNLGEFNAPWDEPLISINNTGEFVNFASLSLGNGWAASPASIITTNRFINHGDIQGGDKIQNSGYFENDGNIFAVNRIENSGDVINAGRISVRYEMLNSATGTFNNIVGGVVEASNRLENRGVFENQSVISLHENFDYDTGQFASAELNNSGIFNNTGSIDVISSVGFNLINSSIFNNNGIINAEGPIQITNSGVFNNLGEFNMLWNTPLSINNSGEFVNFASLSLGEEGWNVTPGAITTTNRFINHANIQGGEVIQNSGYFENNGDIFGANRFENTGDVINAGSLFVRNEMLNLGGATFNNIVGGVVEASNRLENRGVFENQSIVTLYEDLYDYVTGQIASAELNNSGVFNNNGSIDVFSGLNITNSDIFNNNGIINANGPVQITNSGIFNNLGEFNTGWNTSLSINNTGEFVNASNLQLDDVWDPEQAGSIINTNIFVNHADIRGGAAIKNSGYFENDGFIDNVNVFENSGDVINAGDFTVVTGIVNLATSTFNNLVGGIVEVSQLDNRSLFENQSTVLLHEGYDSSTGQLAAAELNNSGVFNNDGIIDANFSHEGLNITNSNMFNNTGSIYTNGSTQITNSGMFNNLGEFSSRSGSPLEINNSGEFVNAAILNLGDNWNETTGSIITSNRFINHGDIQGGESIQNSGYFENNGNVFGVNTFENSGDVINTGWISTFTEMVNLAGSTFNNLLGGVEANGRLENRGVFENQSFVAFNEGYDVKTSQIIPAELINDGLFNQHSTLTVFSYQGFNLTNRGEFNNTGVINAYQGPTQITNYGMFNNLGEFNASELSINNYGEFNNSADLYVGAGQIINKGSFVNHADIFDGGLFENSGYLENNFGIEVSELENTGDVVNTGGIRAYNKLANSAAGVFTNVAGSGARSGYIDNRGLFDNQSQSLIMMIGGISGELNNSGMFNNAGDIYSLYAGFNLINSNDFTNTYEGRIYSGGTTQITNSGDFVNQGSIEINNGSLNINNSGTFTSANYSLVGGGGDIANTGTFINYSSISEFNTISSSGTFINDANASVSADAVIISGRLEGGGDVSVGNGLVITESGTLATAGRLGFMDVSGDLFVDGIIEFGVERYFYVDDGMNVFGDVVLGAESILDVSFLDGRTFDLGSTFDLLLADSITGGFDDFYYDAILGDGLALEWLILESGGQDLLRLGVVSAVPLPASIWLFLTGLAGLMAVRKKRQ